MHWLEQKSQSKHQQSWSMYILFFCCLVGVENETRSRAHMLTTSNQVTLIGQQLLAQTEKQTAASKREDL